MKSMIRSGVEVGVGLRLSGCGRSRSGRGARAGAILAALALSAIAAQAANRYWDGGTTDIGGNGNSASAGGNGTWDTTIKNWDAGAVPHTNWINANNDTAIFAGAAGTVSLGTGITVGGLQFDTANYLVQNNTLTFGAAGNIVATSNATISSVIAGDASLTITKTGSSTLTLSGANTFAGTNAISAGTLALSGGDNRLATNAFVNFTANSKLDLGANSQTLANITVLGAASATATISGSGLLTVNGTTADFAIGAPTLAGSTSTLDMSGLSNFTYDSPTKNFTVGGQRVGGSSSFGAINLAGGTNSIRAAQVKLGQIVAPTGPALPTGYLYLGATNTIRTDLLGLADNGRGCATVQFQSGLSGTPSLTLRGLDGVSRLATMNVLNESPSYTGYTATFDVSAGTLDALVGTLTIGNLSAAASGGSATFSMGVGTLDATSIVLGQSPTSIAAGTLTVSNGTVKAQTFTIGDKSSSGNSVTATLNLNGGATLSCSNLTAGASVGTITRTFNWNDGTIANYDASTDLTISGSGGLTLTLASTGTHAFNIGNGRTGTVGAVISGTGDLTKTGGGKLVLSGNNTYSGATTVSNGTFKLAAAGSISNSAQIAVASGATCDVSAVTGFSVVSNQTLMDNGIVTGAVTVAAGGIVGGGGTIIGNVTNSPGSTFTGGGTNSVGTLTVSNLVVGSNSTYVWNYSGTGGDLVQAQNVLALPASASVVTVNVMRITGGTWPANPAVLFSANSITGSPDLSNWVVNGDCRPGSKCLVQGNQVKLFSPTGLILKIN